MEQQDISLSYDDIGSFVASPASNLELRSLTLHLTQPTLLPHGHGLQDVETNNSQVEQTLTRLAGAIASLKSLSAFSLYVPPHNSGHHFEISQTAIASIIESLPQSCASLEIDTAGLDQPTTGSETPIHLCETLRAVLPRMRHARLSLRTMCSSLCGTTGAALPQNDAPSYHPITLLNMQTLLVNCKQAWGTAPICASAPDSDPAPVPTPARDAWDSVTHGLQALATAPGRVLRPDASLCVVTATPQDDSDRSRYTTLVRADVASRTSHAFPVAFVSRAPTPAWLMRTAEGREVVSSDTAALVAVAEGQAGWVTVGDGVRLPMQVAGGWGLEGRGSPLEEGGVWRAANPGKMHLLWYNEKLSGERLLDGEIRVGESYLSREPLVERTPAGWQRPDMLRRAQLEPL